MKQGGNKNQHVVSGSCAVKVIEVSEIVNVEVKEDRGLHESQIFLQLVTVRQFGEKVDFLFLYLFSGAFKFCNIMTYTDVAYDLLFFIQQRENSCIDDVVFAVFGSVFDNPFPYLFLFNRRPHLFEHLFGGIGMADDIVRFSQQLFFCIAGEFAEFFIDIGDDTFFIGFADNTAFVDCHFVAVQKREGFTKFMTHGVEGEQCVTDFIFGVNIQFDIHIAFGHMHRCVFKLRQVLVDGVVENAEQVERSENDSQKTYQEKEKCGVCSLFECSDECLITFQKNIVQFGLLFQCHSRLIEEELTVVGQGIAVV